MAVADGEYGYHGRYLRIDLSTGQSRFVAIPEPIRRRFIGGCGLGVHILLKESGADVPPLAPEATIVFVFGPLVDTDICAAARFAVVSKSPLTHRINDSLVGGSFSVAGKGVGVDALVVTGRAVKPSVLLIDDGRVRIEPAGNLWGTPCGAAQSRLREQLGDAYEIAVIGPAGENGVRFASIAHGSHYAGRGGSGAVLGSKNIKAVVVRGNRRCRPAHPDKLAAIVDWMGAKSVGPATLKYRESGTVSNLLAFNRLHALPTRNFQRASMEGGGSESLEALSSLTDVARRSCRGCRVACERFYARGADREGKGGARGDSGATRLTYENSFALGPLCGIEDPQIVMEASRRCDDLGMDTISTGGTVAFAMECVEKGFLDVPWLRFGDGRALLRAIDEIGHMRGVGRRLAMGSRRMAEELGGNTLAFAAQVKGLELPGYEPRSLQTMALGLAVNARGADHNRSGAYEVDFSALGDRHAPDLQSVRMAIETEDRAALTDSLLLCKFLRNVFDEIYQQAADMLQAVAGWDVTADELRQAAKRIVTAKKLFNIRSGWQPREDMLPQRFLDAPLPDDGSATLPASRLETMISAYNLGRGWSREGWVGAGQLDELGLADL
ncbi:MAG: aldehyde ferredoxin oxidoreductase family protein [Thermoguttaceae bacterium]